MGLYSFLCVPELSKKHIDEQKLEAKLKEGSFPSLSGKVCAVKCAYFGQRITVQGDL